MNTEPSHGELSEPAAELLAAHHDLDRAAR